MNREEALNTLRRSEGALRACGVAHAALFGSMARGDDRPDSDVDILVEFDPDAHVTVFDYVGVKEYIASLFLQPVDVIDREALKPHLRRPSARRGLCILTPSRTRFATFCVRSIWPKISRMARIAMPSAPISCGCTQSRVAWKSFPKPRAASPRGSRHGHPGIAWREMAGAGNVYRHDYQDVAPPRVWDTVQFALPPLRAAIEQELGL